MDNSVKISFSGDLMCREDQINLIENYGFSNVFDEVSPIFKECDYNIVNLEFPIGDKLYRKKLQRFSYQDNKIHTIEHNNIMVTGNGSDIRMSGPKLLINEAMNAGINCFVTSNNHIADLGEKGIIDTYNYLKSKNVDFIGIYKNELEQRDNSLLIKEINGIKFGIINQTKIYKSFITLPESRFDIWNQFDMLKNINKAKDNNCDLIIAYIHSGRESSINNQRDLKYQIDWLKNCGVDIVICSHAHVPLPIYKTTFGNKDFICAEGLGNFYSDMNYGLFQRISTVLTIVIVKDNGKIYLAYHPDYFWCTKNYIGSGQYKLWPIEQLLSQPDIITDKMEFIKMKSEYEQLIYADIIHNKTI